MLLLNVNSGIDQIMKIAPSSKNPSFVSAFGMSRHVAHFKRFLRFDAPRCAVNLLPNGDALSMIQLMLYQTNGSMKMNIRNQSCEPLMVGVLSCKSCRKESACKRLKLN